MTLTGQGLVRLDNQFFHANDHGGLAATPDDERNLGVEGGRQRSKKLLEV
jgi:hypothetical protein